MMLFDVPITNEEIRLSYSKTTVFVIKFCCFQGFDFRLEATPKLNFICSILMLPVFQKDFSKTLNVRRFNAGRIGTNITIAWETKESETALEIEEDILERFPYLISLREIQEVLDNGN